MKGVICEWPNCFLSFSSKSTLQRHIRNVHKGIRSHVCSKSDCSAAFTTATHLKRHVLNVHITAKEREFRKRKYKCNVCEKKFSNDFSLQRHCTTVHSERSCPSGQITRIVKPSFICAHCERNFNYKDNLKRHILGKHGFSVDCFECHECGYKSTCKSHLKTHISNKHISEEHGARSVLKRSRLCILCNESQHALYKHYIQVHCEDLGIKTISFSSMEEFLNWKKELEDSTVTRFVAYTRSNVENKSTRYYKCHRSGSYTEKLEGRKRARFLRGSKKLNNVCPAFIKLCCYEDTSYEATFTLMHLGHKVNDESELKYIFLRREEREKIAALVASGVPRRRILDHLSINCSNAFLADHRNAAVNKVDLLTYKDIHNIEKSFNVKCDKKFERPYQDDAKNLEVFANEHKDSILFYKRQNECSPEEFLDYQLKDDDLILIFMCSSQEAMLKKHASDVVCMDGTHGSNPYGFLLHTLLVLDYDGEGFPAAFVLTNRNDKNVIKIFLRILREKVGLITPNYLMTDMQQTYYNAWIEEMGTPIHHLHCVNTNTHVESFNKVLKYVHENGRNIKDLFSGLHVILRFVTEKLKSQRLKVIGGKPTPRLVALRKGHQRALEHPLTSIGVSEEGWLVPSFQTSDNGCVEMYTVCKIRDSCPAKEDGDIHTCHLMCSECGDCAHKYSCTCVENAIKMHMCKHIHATLLFFNSVTENYGPNVVEETENGIPKVEEPENDISNVEEPENDIPNVEEPENYVPNVEEIENIVLDVPDAANAVVSEDDKNKLIKEFNDLVTDPRYQNRKDYLIIQRFIKNLKVSLESLSMNKGSLPALKKVSKKKKLSQKQY